MASEISALKMAEKIRSEFSFEENVNIDEILKSKKFMTQKRNLPEDIAIVFSATNRNAPVLLIDSDIDEGKARFAKAHALGHFLLSKNSAIFVDKKSSISSSIAPFSDDDTEKVANSFAAALLAPPNLLRKKIAEEERNGKTGDEAFKAVAATFAVGIGVVALALLLGGKKGKNQ